MSVKSTMVARKEFVDDGRLTHEADFGLEDWEETLFFVPSDPNGAYDILAIAKHYDIPEFAEILKAVSLRLAAYESTGLSPDEIMSVMQEQKTAASRIEVPCTAGTLCAEVGGDPNFPEIYTYLRRADNAEIDIAAVCGDGIAPAGVSRECFAGQKENNDGLSIHLYRDTDTDSYTDRFWLTKKQLNVSFEQGGGHDNVQRR